jgi:GNAT superfamily N-acetyltransferase
MVDEPQAASPAAIRRARPDESGSLSDLAFRSKAHWGYDDAFMAASRDDLTLAPGDIAGSTVYVAEEGGQPVGFYRLRRRGDDAELTDLWIEPAAIGRGYGRQLWRHAVATAGQIGCRQLIWQSEPHAEGFYLAMGAERIGDSPSTVFPGRMLPLMRFVLSPTTG